MGMHILLTRPLIMQHVSSIRSFTCSGCSGVLALTMPQHQHRGRDDGGRVPPGARHVYEGLYVGNCQAALAEGCPREIS